MTKGRKPLPAEIKKIRGTAQPCREQKAGNESAISRLTDVKPPAWLDSVGKKIFKSKAEQLIALRVLTVLDIDLLALYAQSYSMVVEALKKIKTTSQTSNSRSGDTGIAVRLSPAGTDNCGLNYIRN